MALSPVATRKFSELYDTEGQKNVLDKETEHLLVPILKNLKYGIGENIMDHGCGTGRVGSIYFVPPAEKSASKIYAIDTSESMISHAKEFYPHPRVTYYKTDLLDPAFPLNNIKFNKIFSIHVLIVVPFWRVTLKKMFDLLKPGGILIAMLVVQSSDFFHVHKHIKEHPKWEDHGKDIVVPDWIEEGADPEEFFYQALMAIGFTVLTIDTHERTHTFPSKAECIELYMAGYPGPHEKNLTTPEHRHELHETLHDFLHVHTNTDAKNRNQKQEHHVRFETLIFSAQKPRI